MQPHHHDIGSKERIDKTISALWTNVFCLVFLGISVGFFGVLYLLVGHTISLEDLAFLGPLTFGLTVGLGSMVHELVHAFGFVVFGKVPREAIKIGFSLRGLMLYAHCQCPVKANAYRIAIILPGIVTGLLPAVIGLLAANLWLTIAGAFLVGGAGGDLLILWTLRSVPPTALIQDHPTKVGCEVLMDS